MQKRASPAVESVRLPFKTRRMRLESIESNGSAFVTCWFSGDDLRDLQSPGAGDHIKLQVPDASGHLVVPAFDEAGERLANRADLALRDMTPRIVDAAAGRLRIDFVRHLGGVIGPWLERAAVGDELAFVGPRGSRRIVEAVDEVRFVADLTALPSAERRFDELPDTVTGELHLVVESAADIDGISVPERIRVITHELGTEGVAGGWPGVATALEASLASIEPTQRILIWAAGEASGVASIRAVANAVAREGVFGAFNGYWRAGEAEYDHHAPLPEL